jgi:hypothetical protein
VNDDFVNDGLFVIDVNAIVAIVAIVLAVGAA